MLSLTACGRTEFIGPPPALLEDCPETVVPVHTNADMAVAVKEARKDLHLCNADKASLRTWVAEMRK
jgi:hypothetical protein